MKHALLVTGFLLLFVSPAIAADRLVPLDDPSLSIASALGKQVNVRFADSIAKGRLPQADYDGLILSDAPDGKICLFGRDQGLDPEAPALAEFARKEEGDVCFARGDVQARIQDGGGAGQPAVPFYATDKKACTWQWKTVKGIGLWTEDCTFDNGRWNVVYDETNDWFALQVNGADPYPVLRQFRTDGGPEALLPELKAKSLVLDDAECVFAPSAEQPVPAGWEGWNVVPTGKRKQDYDALPDDEVPEPPCGELGMAVDFIGFFMTAKDHPGRILYVNLGQDGTMIDLPSVTLTE
jgi:hypothetical protein